MGKSPHDGHRDRVREDFLKNGFSESTPDHKILELLLFYSIPRKDTNEIAHALLNRFGSISGVFDASPEELMKVGGIGQKSASLIKLIMPVASRYMSDISSVSGKYNSLRDVSEYIVSKFIGCSVENFAVASFSAAGKMLGFDILNCGDPSSVKFSTRDVVETVLKYKACHAIIAHNHPRGVALPSEGDIEVTEKLKMVLDNINVKLLDHLIVSGDDYVSMSQSAAFNYIFNPEQG